MVQIETSNQRDISYFQDLLLGDVMLDKAEWFVSYHEHDSLLQHMEEESLTEEEKETAWNEYKAEREGRRRIFTAAAESKPFFLSYPFTLKWKQSF